MVKSEYNILYFLYSYYIIIIINYYYIIILDNRQQEQRIKITFRKWNKKVMNMKCGLTV
jgi:hypothetical protein